MVLHPDIARAKIDTCYLDTTYLNPKYCFPPQPQVIDACAQLARKVVVGLPDTAPPLVDLKPPIFDQKPDLDDNGDVKPDLGGGVGKFEPVLAEQQAEERGKAMMKDWLVNVKAEAGGGDTKDGVKMEGEELVEIDRKPKGRTLVVMGTYSIGKERIVKGKLSLASFSSGMELISQPSPKPSDPRSTATPVKRVSSYARRTPSSTLSSLPIHSARKSTSSRSAISSWTGCRNTSSVSTRTLIASSAFGRQGGHIPRRRARI